MEDKIGIWIDKRNAHLIRLKEEGSVFETIPSSIEEFHVVGGHRSKTAWGPVDTVKEKSYVAREKQQKKKFFDSIAKSIGDIKYVYIFGPAMTKMELKKFLEDKHGIAPEILMAETADSMTKNQMVAEVRKAFRHI
jgi:stalled ribosome rescue protein Dom34